MGKNNYTNEAASVNNNNMPVISRDIYSISDSYENPTTTDVNYAKINSAFDRNDNSNNNRENFENLYSQVTKKPSATQSSYNNNRNPSIRNDQALYMNTFYSS